MIRIKNYARAKSLYEELMPFHPDDGIIVGEYADLLHSMELLDEAVAAFERAMATGNVNGTVINDYAALLFKMASRTGDETMLERSRKLIATANIDTLVEHQKFGLVVNRKLMQGHKFGCAVCGLPASSICTKCGKTHYCGRGCQTKDWKRHKSECKSYAKCDSKAANLKNETDPASISGHVTCEGKGANLDHANDRAINRADHQTNSKVPESKKVKELSFFASSNWHVIILVALHSWKPFILNPYDFNNKLKHSCVLVCEVSVSVIVFNSNCT
jgi:tetratricopeptide (TPR) repeat protein